MDIRRFEFWSQEAKKAQKHLGARAHPAST